MGEKIDTGDAIMDVEEVTGYLREVSRMIQERQKLQKKSETAENSFNYHVFETNYAG